MNEKSDAAVVMSISHPLEVLDDARYRGWSVWMLLDHRCHSCALQQLYALEPDTEKTLLFLDSPLEYMHELSPRFAVLAREAAMIGWIEELDPQGWGMILVSEAPAEEVLAHLRSLVLAKTEGKDVIFRVWDGRVLARICSAMPAEARHLLGPVRFILTRTNEQGWIRIDRPEESTDASTIARPCPWYMFSALHAELFRDARAQVLARNIALSMYSPDPASSPPLPPGDESLLTFAVRHIGRGLGLGLSRDQSLELFVRCCLLHGESFPDAVGTPVLKPFAACPMNEDAAVAAMLKICSQGSSHG